MINKSVKEIIFHKAQLMRSSKKYAKYLQGILNDLDIKDNVEAACVGAIDAMIYDVACSLDFTKQKKTVNDWSSYQTRKRILKELWKPKPKSLRGRVVDKHDDDVDKHKKEWDFNRTINECLKADKELSEEGLNPAPKFRKYRLNKDKKKVRAWVRGCRFEWL